MILSKGGNNKAGGLSEVYNHPEPSQSVEITPKKTLAARRWIIFSRIGSRHRLENRRHVVQHLRSASGEVALGSLVEQHSPAIWIGCLVRVAWHVHEATRRLGRNSARLLLLASHYAVATGARVESTTGERRIDAPRAWASTILACQGERYARSHRR
jgi:hypothetical protein